MTAIETLAVAVSTSLVAYGVLIVHYKTALPRRRPAKKPGIAFLPKYSFSMELPPTIAVAEDPVALLGERLARVGFQLITHEGRKLRFSRGALLGDLSVERAKIDLEFVLPLTSNAHASIAYGAFALFDAGALWSLSYRVESAVHAGAGI